MTYTFVCKIKIKTKYNYVFKMKFAFINYGTEIINVFFQHLFSQNKKEPKN